MFCTWALFNNDKAIEQVVDKLKQFIGICQSNSDILHYPELAFFKEYIENLGGKIPRSKMSNPPTTETTPESPSEELKEEESEESDLEIDSSGCVEPDELSPDQNMGDASKVEISEEESDKADEKRREAMQILSENAEKAIGLFTEAIVINPTSALLFAKRGQAYLKVDKPNACIKDCSRALELNPDSAAAYKFRGRAYRLLGEWEKAAKDFRQACNIDFDEQTDEWLKEVNPNAKKIEQHLLKIERKKVEKLLKEKKASKSAPPPQQAPKFEVPPSFEGGGQNDFYKLMQDPEILLAFQDPEVAAAFQDISTNFANFVKYKDNPKVMSLIKKLSSKFPGGPGAFGNMGAGFPGMGGMGGMAGMGGMGGSGGAPPADDNLD
ncbi:unnamed protein product [Brassicogethes aeneus]|uniref:STI1 domain-containing protein n=1 Tax=Brassicogethes aeneus TaxID=1431903 RepID=A0A9P0FFR6_BRAAE|nr:unnamed protein product [Brassicogethes aeneus]